MKVTVIGCGGVGGALARNIARFLAHHDQARFGGRPATLVLVDGDMYEPHNAARQSFSRIGNKAEILAEEITEAHGGRLIVEAEPVYLGRQNDVQLIREWDIVLCCADKFSVRRQVGARMSQLANILGIAGGNDITDGEIQVHARIGGKDLTLPFANQYHPEVEQAPDDNPADRKPGCDVEAARGDNTQLYITNAFAAQVMANAFYAALVGRLNYDEVLFDVVQNMTRVERRTEGVRIPAWPGRPGG